MALAGFGWRGALPSADGFSGIAVGAITLAAAGTPDELPRQVT